MKIGSITVFIAFLFAFTSGCTENPSPNTMSLSFSIDNISNDTIHLWQTELIGFSKINEYEIILNQSGSGVLEVEYPNNSFFSIQIGDLIFPIIYLNGSSLAISGNRNDLQNTLHFDGDESFYTDYLNRKGSILRKYDKQDGLAFFQLDSSKFWIRLDAMNKEIDSLNKWLSKRSNHDQISSLLILDSFQQSNIFILNYALVKGYRESKYLIDIPYNPDLLSSNSIDYGYALAFNFDLQIEGKARKNSGANDNDSIRYLFPQILADYIKSLEIPEFAKEHYLTRFLAISFGSNQSNPVTESVYSDWLIKYPNSQYKNLISSFRDQMRSLSNGQIAPELSGIDSKGNKFAIENLRGSIIYIDVWATWCPGCVEKLPYMDSLQTKLGFDSDVKFLFVSMDKDTAKWKHYLGKLPNKGLHINASNTELYKNYMIHGIPRYLIIDKSGKIYDSNAPDPDSNEILEILTELDRQAS